MWCLRNTRKVNISKAFVVFLEAVSNVKHISMNVCCVGWYLQAWLYALHISRGENWHSYAFCCTVTCWYVADKYLLTSRVWLMTKLCVWKKTVKLLGSTCIMLVTWLKLECNLIKKIKKWKPGTTWNPLRVIVDMNCVLYSGW